MLDIYHEKKSIIFFDGVCNLYNGFVQFIIEHDHDSYFSFASLQSEFAAQLRLNGKIKSIDTIDSIILIEDGNVYYKSTAILKIARKLNGWWSFLYRLKLSRFLLEILHIT
ncbi:thiol-disulfide oxidoreductase DCC family protein [Pedobacter mendelii]|uniref:DUF393 domain-containing protein n=1 Tax=Pedobacter mendelii TaxID=1908240 RepID=A0ABQ2BHQ7_9SPHI|nr:DCC1-like thiol-disulfide oxidoreductase family protein [Pedobacter mendelii]GGI26528.1 hypothetical protein GCM10008119_23100 [Pedobacter mendelii]